MFFFLLQQAMITHAWREKQQIIYIKKELSSLKRRTQELDSKLLIASQESVLVCKVIRKENIVLEGQFV